MALGKVGIVCICRCLVPFMPKCLLLEMVLPQRTEELSWSAKNIFVLMEITSLCVF